MVLNQAPVSSVVRVANVHVIQELLAVLLRSPLKARELGARVSLYSRPSRAVLHKIMQQIHISQLISVLKRRRWKKHIMKLYEINIQHLDFR